MSIRERQGRVGSEERDVVRLNQRSVVGLLHRKRDRPAQDLVQLAVMLGIQMRDQDDGQPRGRREVRQQLLKGLESARRRADSDDRELVSEILRLGD